MNTAAFSYSGGDTRLVCEICGAKPACWRIRYRDARNMVYACYLCAIKALRDGEFIEEVMSERALAPYEKEK